ncbi:hypothetical protein YC2023_093814 [Brassica napus]
MECMLSYWNGIVIHITTMVEDWELSRLELGLQGSKEQWQGSLQVIARQMLGGNKFQEAFEAERSMKLRSIFFSGDCKEMQGDTEDEQVCSITGGKLKRR